MEEIARTWEDAGLTPLTFDGAAALYAFVAASALGERSPEEWRIAEPSLDQVVRALAGRPAG